MAEELNKIMANALPLASNVTDSDMLLMIQNGRNVRRVPPSLMKGKKGDPGDNTYLRYTGQWVQHKLGINGAWVNLIPVSDMRGPSAYALAVENGYKGTEVEWLASLSKASEDAAAVALAAAKTAEETNASVSAAEGLRAEAERLRAEAEALRQEAERLRAAAESARASKEDERIASETLRDTAEQVRIREEAMRAEADRLREEAEKIRQTGELSRITEEEKRALAELERQRVENERIVGESRRDEAELLRAAGETDRIEKENTRISSETARIEEEKKRITAETGRATAETSRKEAETARTEAERLRAEAEAQRAKDSAAAIENAAAATTSANTSAAAAQDTADHPTYIGADHYVYKWNKETKAYDKTDIFVKGDAFSIRKVYESISRMETDLNNPEIKEGDFVLINTGDVENPDNARLYIRSSAGFDFLVDMSGAIGFTGKTPQLGIGTVAGGETAAVSLSEDGTDPDGNPKFKLNLVLPQGEKGDTPVLTAGQVTTGAPGTPATAELVPDGMTDAGIPCYRLDLTIPRGDTGSGNVSVPPAALKAGVTYLFRPGADGSAEGEFIEYTAPAQVQSDWSATDTGLPSFIQNKPSSFTPSAHTHTKADISDFPASMPASDVHDWAKQPSKPTYNASDVGAAPSNHTHDYIPITGTNNLRGSLLFTDPGTPGVRGIEGVAGGNDYWRVVGGASETNAGYLELATGDDGNEPIHVTQYAGHFTTVRRTATLLDAAGNTNFPGTVTSGGQPLVRTNDARLINARPASGGAADSAALLSITASRPNYGSGLIFNQSSSTAGYPDAGWYSCIRMLHANSAGYFQELAFKFDGEMRPYYRRMNAGALSNWERLAFASDLPGLASSSTNGLMAASDKAKMDRLQRYASTTTCNALNVDYEIHYVNLSANATLSVSASGTGYNGRTITAFVYCAAARTIAIPTTGSYISMCGSSYTCPAGRWVEFNLTCVNGIWHIAKLEQE